MILIQQRMYLAFMATGLIFINAGHVFNRKILYNDKVVSALVRTDSELNLIKTSADTVLADKSELKRWWKNEI